ncbi:MAG: BamA/TamA family outer membrane protein [Candidatus Zixiibacteriota bacterium]|nr:MAG: BamA/TamA family outer membrane protein [candidate division Zixibacteria bacterium]
MTKLHQIRITLATAICAFIVSGVSAEEQAVEPVDSIQMRTPEKPEKTLSEKILAVPQFIIDLPFEILEFTSKVIIDDVIDTRFTRRTYQVFDDLHRIYGFYPTLGYGANMGIKGGIGFRSKGVLSEGERLKLKGSYSTHDYQRYKAVYIAPVLASKEGVTFYLSYDKKPWESFFGIGFDSNEDDEVTYCSEETNFRMIGSWDLYAKWSAEVVGGYRVVNLYDGQNPDQEGDLDVIRQTLGLNRQSVGPARVLSLTSTVTHDWRNSKFQPSRGGVEILSLSYNKGVNRAKDLEYLAYSLDLRHYFEVFKKRLFAVRVMAQSIDTQGDSPELPFYLRSKLGGWDIMRGYREYRFIDNDMALMTIEYRYPIWQIVDAFVFIDEARVFNDIFDEFTLRNWKYSFGGGLRIWGVESSVMSLQVAGSSETVQFYLEVAEEF